MADPLVTTSGSNFSAADLLPLVITYHPKNIAVCNILLRNYSILWDDDTTKVAFDEPPLKSESMQISTKIADSWQGSKNQNRSYFADW